MTSIFSLSCSRTINITRRRYIWYTDVQVVSSVGCKLASVPTTSQSIIQSTKDMWETTARAEPEGPPAGWKQKPGRLKGCIVMKTSRLKGENLNLKTQLVRYFKKFSNF